MIERGRHFLLFYLCIIGVLIVMFFNGLCFHALIYLVLLVDGLSHPYFLYEEGFYLFYFLTFQVCQDKYLKHHLLFCANN